MAVAVYAIVTLAVVREYLKIGSSDTSSDAFFERWIDSYSKAVEDFIRGPVKEQTYSGEIYDGDGSRSLVVRHWPITALETPGLADVQYRTAPTESWQNLVTTNVANILLKANRPWEIFLYDAVFPKGHQNVRVGYKAGYTTIPGEIERVVVEAVAEIFRQSSRGEGRIGVGSKSMSPGTGVSATDSYVELNDKHKKILLPFRLPVV